MELRQRDGLWGDAPVQDQVTTFNASQLKGKAVWNFQGLAYPDAVAFGPLDSGKSEELSIPVTVPKDAALGRHDIWCHVKPRPAASPPTISPSSTSRCWSSSSATPAPTSSGQKPHEIPASASVKLSAPEPLKADCAGQIEIPPTNTVTLPVTVAGQDQLRELSEMAADISIGKSTRRLVRAVMPRCRNGDFEMDTR